MHEQKTLWQPLLIPVLSGLVIALLIIILRPDLFPALHSSHPAQPQQALPSGLSGPVSYSAAVEKAAPAVVNIFTQRIVHQRSHPLFSDPFFERFLNEPGRSQRMKSSLGSGVIMNKEGYILTNEHVINGADEIVVALADGRESPAIVIGTDPEIDLAVLKTELPDIPHINIAERRQLSTGDVVLAIGNPFGVGQTVTMGIVSATGRNQLGLNTYEDYIQTDAAINPGNSGGALINAHGNLVGINAAIYSKSGGSQGIGFAIPAAISAQILADIARHGATIRGWMGIEVQEATPSLLLKLGLPQELKGLIVTGLAPDGPAEKSGLAIGDIITGLNGNENPGAKEAMNQIAALRPGDGIDIDFIRAGQKHSTMAIAGKRASD